MKEMTAEMEFPVGGVTTGMVEEVWAEVLRELATPGSPIHEEYDTRRLDLTQPWKTKIEEKSNSTGTTILMTIGTTVALWELESLWRDVVRVRIVRLFRVEPGELLVRRSAPVRGEGWPSNDDPMQVAVATRIALFAAGRLFPDDKLSPEEDQLASFIMWATDVAGVDGRGFAEFLADAQRQIEYDLRLHTNVRTALPHAAAALNRARPIDIIGRLYGILATLVAEAYGRPALAQLPLERMVVEPDATGNHLRGAVPRSRSSVMLTLDTGFDAVAFARLSRVLTHELVCHAAACHPMDPRPSTTQFFEEGFMDMTAQILLLQFLETEDLEELVPAGFVSPAQMRRHHSRRQALDVGAAAWTACRIAVGKDRRSQDSPRSGSAEATTVDATLRLNSTENLIGDKDRFVELARNGRSGRVKRFVRLTRAEISPEEVFA